MLVTVSMMCHVEEIVGPTCSDGCGLSSLDSLGRLVSLLGLFLLDFSLGLLFFLEVLFLDLFGLLFGLLLSLLLGLFLFLHFFLFVFLAEHTKDAGTLARLGTLLLGGSLVSLFLCVRLLLDFVCLSSDRCSLSSRSRFSCRSSGGRGVNSLLGTLGARAGGNGGSGGSDG